MTMIRACDVCDNFLSKDLRRLDIKNRHPEASWVVYREENKKELHVHSIY